MNYFELLRHPPEEAKGKTRWWWYGCCVTKEEILRQLKWMKEANLGGAELQILYPLVPDKKEQGIKNIEYFSPTFFDILRFTSEQAKILDMTLDFTLGSSWPFGGPFVPHSMAPQSAVPYQIDVTGPKLFSYDFTNRFAGKIVQVILGKMDHSKMVESSLIDLTDQINRKYLFSWPWGYTLKDLPIPEGDWKIVVLVINKYRQTVPAPAPNAGGYAIDHCRRDVSDFYFKNAAFPIIEKVGQGKIHNFFCDSIELEGNNWTEILWEEFRKRRHYSLEPYIYALWGEIDEITPYIRSDYFQTLSELTIENFFANFTDWCHKLGTKSRVQVHGTWGDILKSYGSADIPEGETFGSHDKLYVNTIHRRLASSAGSIYDKPIVSNESFTWLRMPRFLVTLEMMKGSVDAIFLDGINRIYNHGYSYSPEYAGEPGFSFYASSHICHTNTWWSFYHNLGRYIQTVSAFMQLGPVCSELAIYLPQWDIYSESPLGDLHLAMKLEERLHPDCIDYLNKQGFYPHFLNDEAIQSIGSIVEGGITIQSNTYKTLLLIACDTIPLATAQKIQEFVKKGGNLVMVDSRPEKNPCFLDREKADQQIKEIFDSLHPLMAKDRFADLIQCIRKVHQPPVEIRSYNHEVGCIHRNHQGNDVYFIANIADTEKITDIWFKNTKNMLAALDPLHGCEKEIINKVIQENGVTVTIRLSAFESCILVFGQSEERIHVETTYQEETLDMKESWTLTIDGSSYSLDSIHCWEKIKGYQHYAKNAKYSRSVFITKENLSADKILLDIENLYHCANVSVNGAYVGQIWKRPNQINLTSFLKEGTNLVELEVFNLWINRVIDPAFIEAESKKWLYPENSTLDEWPYHTEVINDIVRKRLLTTRESEIIKQPQPSGIDGNVQLRFFYRVR